MRESSKALARRRNDPFWHEILVGDGIDVGAGDDPLRKEWFPGLRSIRPFDKQDGDAQYLSHYVKAESLDFVYASNCLEHLERPASVLLEWLRVVKPGGHVIFIVPDEDLYEQGVFPSRWAAEHKFTFTLFKDQSWCHRSISIARLVTSLPSCRVRRIVLADTGYNRAIKGVDQTMSSAEAFWEVVLGKLSIEKKPRTFKHSGARGDLLYGLAAMMEMGGGTVYVNRSEGSHFGIPVCDEEMNSIVEFLELTGYVTAKEWKGESVECDMDGFRMLNLDYTHLSDAQEMYCGVAHDPDKPWIDPTRIEPIQEADIVIARSSRYHAPFDWHELRPWVERCVFVGTRDEHRAFVEATGMAVRRVLTPTWKALAGVIRGGKLFVGNQSMAYAMAEAMKVPRVLEAFPICPNCDPRGPDGHLRLTQDVIRRYVEGFGNADESGVSRNPWLCKSFCKPKNTQRERIEFGLVVPVVAPIAKFEALLNSARASGCEVVVIEQGASFEEMANCGAARVQSPVICIVDPREDIELVDVEMVVQQLADGKTGLVGSCIDANVKAHVSGPCFAVSRMAYEQLGLFNTAMLPGRLNMLEVNLRFIRGNFGCKSASIGKWNGWSRDDHPEHNERNVEYLRKVYGVKK